MPKYFHFVGRTTRYNRPLDVERCTFIRDNQQQCRRRVCIGLDMCAQHTRSHLHLRVGPSSIPGGGMGLFACDDSKGDNEIVFEKDKTICNYNGEQIDKKELTRRYGMDTAPYGIQLYTHQDKYEDCAGHRGIGCMINHKPGRKANCIFSVAPRPRTHAIIKCGRYKHIRNGEELFVDYGNSYELQNQDVVQHSTNQRKYNV
jgi:hypothetical protein